MQQTAWNFVAVSRGWLPPAIGTVLWFTPDDSSTTVRVPFYGSITDIPSSFADPVGQDPNAAVAHGPASDAFKMSLDSIFWVSCTFSSWLLVYPVSTGQVNQLVSNLAYGERYNVLYPMIQDRIIQLEERMILETAQLEKEVASVYATNPTKAVEMLTNASTRLGKETTEQWLQFWMFLFATIRDGFTVTPNTGRQCVPGSGQYNNCTSRLDPYTKTTGYSDAWYARIVEDSDNKEHFAVPKHNTERARSLEDWKVLRMNKKRRV